MKKNTIIAILIILCVVSMAFGIYEKQRADAAEQRAIANETMAREAEQRALSARMMAEEQQRLAEINAREALRQSALAVEALKKQRR
jgi:hypothetical protein